MKLKTTKYNLNHQVSFEINTKNDIDKFIEINYDWLVSVAENVLGKSSKNDTDANDLISNLVIYLYENKDNILLKYLNDVMFKKLCVSYIKKQSSWNKTLFKKQFKFDFAELDELSYEKSIDSSAIELVGAPEKASDYIKDLMNLGFNENQIEKVLKFKIIEKDLNIYDSNLIDMYINKNMSYAEISKKCNIPVTSVFFLVKELRETIFNKIKNL